MYVARTNEGKSKKSFTIAAKTFDCPFILVHCIVSIRLCAPHTSTVPLKIVALCTWKVINRCALRFSHLHFTVGSLSSTRGIDSYIEWYKNQNELAIATFCKKCFIFLLFEYTQNGLNLLLNSYSLSFHLFFFKFLWCSIRRKL